MNFDFNLYKKLYYDVRYKTNNEIIEHYKKYGHIEGRIFNLPMLKYRINKLNKIQEMKNIFLNNLHFEDEQKLINIIIRTSDRPKCFNTNIISIKDQNYDNLKLHISYDNSNTKIYINNILSDKNLNYKLYEVEKKKIPYFYNDYPNQILSEIKSGYIMFLDDDDMFTHKNALKYINIYLEMNRYLTWNYLRSDNIIGITNGKIKSGKVTSCGFCYNSSHKSKWKTDSDGDYHFANDLINNNNLKIAKLDKILTTCINKNVIYGEGKCKDIE